MDMTHQVATRHGELPFSLLFFFYLPGCAGSSVVWRARRATPCHAMLHHDTTQHVKQPHAMVSCLFSFFFSFTYQVVQAAVRLQGTRRADPCQVATRHGE